MAGCVAGRRCGSDCPVWTARADTADSHIGPPGHLACCWRAAAPGKAGSRCCCSAAGPDKADSRCCCSSDRVDIPGRCWRKKACCGRGLPPRQAVR